MLIIESHLICYLFQYLFELFFLDIPVSYTHLDVYKRQAIGILFGGIDFTSLRYVITPASGDMAEAAIYYGRFIQNIINFLLIALVIFTIIRIINKFCRKKEESIPEPAAVEPSEEAVLLREIRDLISRNEKWHSIK